MKFLTYHTSIAFLWCCQQPLHPAALHFLGAFVGVGRANYRKLLTREWEWVIDPRRLDPGTVAIWSDLRQKNEVECGVSLCLVGVIGPSRAYPYGADSVLAVGDNNILFQINEEGSLWSLGEAATAVANLQKPGPLIREKVRVAEHDAEPSNESITSVFHGRKWRFALAWGIRLVAFTSDIWPLLLAIFALAGLLYWIY